MILLMVKVGALVHTVRYIVLDVYAGAERSIAACLAYKLYLSIHSEKNQPVSLSDTYESSPLEQI